MGKIIISRKNDKGINVTDLFGCISIGLMAGFFGIPFGAILSGVMQNILDDYSDEVRYKYFFMPIILFIIIAEVVLIRDEMKKNHHFGRCLKCRYKMKPMTERDSLFYISEEKDQIYEPSLHYFARYMVRISSERNIPPNKQGCYLCGYVCPNCSHRMVRVAVFLPASGRCEWKKSYYFDYQEFITVRGSDDILSS